MFVCIKKRHIGKNSGPGEQKKTRRKPSLFVFYTTSQLFKSFPVIFIIKIAIGSIKKSIVLINIVLIKSSP